MDIQAVTTVTNEVKYRSKSPRLTAEDLAAIAKDMKERKVPKEARVILGTANSLTVRF